MPKINIEKLKKELEKGTVEEQYSAFQELKDFIHKNMEKEQKDAEDKATELQSKMQRLNGNN